MTTWLPIPVTFPSASAITFERTATRITSASETSPPSLPSSFTSWPALRQRLANPPPTFPLPIVAIFMRSPSRLARLEELDGIARWVVDEDLRAAGSLDDVAPEREAGCAQALDLRFEV